MFKTTGIIVLLLSMAFGGSGVFAGTIKNETPSKGEWDFRLETQWELDSAGDDMLVQVRSLAVDENGNVFVFDRKMSKFYVFSPEGKFLYSFGKKGEGPGEYKWVFNFHLFRQNMAVPDQAKIHFFTKDGRFINSKLIGSMVSPRAFIDENRFLMVKSDHDEKEKFDQLQVYDLTTGKRTTIAELKAEKSLKASAGGIRLQVKDSNTTPMIITTVKDNTLYFGKNDKYLIKKTGLDGREIFSFSLETRKQKEIPESFKRKRFENMKLNGRKMPKEMVDQMIKNMGDHSTFYNRIRVDENGLIYIYVNDVTNETGQEIDIFSPEGKYLYHSHIKLPEGFTERMPYVIKGNFLYTFAEDEEGEGKLIKFKINKPTI